LDGRAKSPRPTPPTRPRRPRSRSVQRQFPRRCRDTEPFSYDVLDRVESTTDARNKTIFQSYDGLSRTTQTREGGATGKLLSSWTYDTAPRGKGKIAAATRHGENGDYVKSISAYDALGRPASTTVTIPASEGPLAGTYTSRSQ
jgi:hypothetical protein